MDISFDIQSEKGDLVRVALSYYDTESLQAFTDDPLTLSLVFYDVALIRVAGSDTVGIKILKAVSDVLYRFLCENDTAILCFYCDDLTDVPRRHKDMSSQEYRSNLFSKMFDMHVKDNKIRGIVNSRIKIGEGNDARYAHFITPHRYLPAVKMLEELIMEK